MTADPADDDPAGRSAGAGEDAGREPDTSPVPDFPAGLDLSGRAVLVAGAGQGIGRQTTHALAQAGAGVACLDYDRDAAAHVADETGGVPLVADVRERAQVREALGDADDALGGIDGIVDIVGMARYGPLVETTDEDWRWTFDMVLRHAYLLAQLGAPRLADGGAMCFIASVSGITGAQWHAAYGAAKAGLMSLVRSTAVELGPQGVRVNAVAPGVVLTPRVDAFLDEESRRANRDNAPLGRIATPADIAGAVLFLMSDLADYVTGQTLVVDGGVGAKFPYPLSP